jgi:signal transduction histidine kinase
VTAVGPPRPVSEPVARQLLFVVQEAVLNAVHHGQPRRVDVTVAFAADGSAVEIAVRDDGLGFVPGSQPGPESAHFGIQGMRERAEMLGGTLAIESAPGRGTTVTVRVPCPEPVAAEEEP